MVHAAIQISPDRLNLGDAEQERIHEAKNIESHLFGRGWEYL